MFLLCFRFAALAVFSMVGFEIRVRFDRFDSRFPSGVPVVGGVQDILHEDLEVNKHSALQILTNVVVVVASAVPVDSARVAILLPQGGRPKGDGSGAWIKAGFVLWCLGVRLDRRRRGRVGFIRLDRR